MQSLQAGLCTIAIAMTLLNGCSSSSESPSASSGGDDGAEVFNGTMSSVEPHCAVFDASATDLLSTLPGALLQQATDPSPTDPTKCEVTANITDVLDTTAGIPSVYTLYGTASLAVWTLDGAVDVNDSLYIAPTFTDKMAPVTEAMKQYDGTDLQAKIVLPQHFSAPGWTYGFDSLTSAFPNRGDGEISLVLTTKGRVLQCRYYAPTRAPLSHEAVTALCDEIRNLVYSD